MKNSKLTKRFSGEIIWRFNSKQDGILIDRGSTEYLSATAIDQVLPAAVAALSALHPAERLKGRENDLPAFAVFL